MPGPDWQPEPSWPARPKRWNLLVDPEFLMAPVDLSQDLDFGPPARVTKKQLKEACLGAADAIAWQICRAACERNEDPLVTMAGAGEHIRTATAKAKDRVFSKLITETTEWVRSTQGSIHEWEAALQHARMILDKKDAFDGLVDKRVRAVVVAAVAPPIQKTPPTPRSAPEFIRTAPLSEQTRGPGKRDKTQGRRDVWIGLTVIGLVGGAILVFGAMQNGSSGSAALPSVKPGFDPGVVQDLERQADWFQSGDFYVKWVANSQYTCNPGVACTEIWLETPLYDGCGTAEPMVDLLKNGKSIGTATGRANNLTTGVPQRVHIQARQGLDPDQVQINHVTCKN